MNLSLEIGVFCAKSLDILLGLVKMQRELSCRTLQGKIGLKVDYFDINRIRRFLIYCFYAAVNIRNNMDDDEGDENDKVDEPNEVEECDPSVFTEFKSC